MRDLAEAHARQGHEVGIVCDSTTGGSYEDSLFDEIRPFLALGLVRLPIRRSIGPADLAALWKSYKEIRSLQPDILHGHGAKGGALARIIGSALRVNKYRVARLYSPHGGSLHYNGKKPSGKIVFLLERLQEYLTDAIVFVCDFERRTYEHKVGKPRIRSERIFNGIDDRDFRHRLCPARCRGFSLYRHAARPEGSGPLHRCLCPDRAQYRQAAVGDDDRRRAAEGRLRTDDAGTRPRPPHRDAAGP